MPQETLQLTYPITISGRRLLGAGDFTFLGSFDIQGNVAGDFNYGQCLTHRRVGGQLRFLTSPYNGGNANVVEFAQVPFGSVLNTLTNTWNNVFPSGWGGGQVWRSLFWDDPNQRLINTVCLDYPQSGITSSENRLISTCQLGTGGAVTQGPAQLLALQGIGQRAVVGGVRKIPQWFQTANGTGPYLVGFGGYTSLMAQGLGPSMGPFVAAIPDPGGSFPASPIQPSSGQIPASSIRMMADYRSGARATDWYASGSPTSFDRGIRNNNVANYYDSGDPRPNPQTRPTVPPALGAQWLSPSPDGNGRWVWGDSYYGCGEWIDNDAGTQATFGVVCVQTCATGDAYYATSQLNSDGRMAELQVFDPADYAAVLAGTKQPWAVKPKARLDISAIISNGCQALRGPQDATPWGAVTAATYDATTGIMWLICHWAFTTAPYNSRMYAFQVAQV